MKRRGFTFLAGAAVIGPLPLRAQAQPKLRRVGSLSIASQAATLPFYNAFKDGMRELGWVEGQNVAYRFLFADGQVERLDALAGELLAQGMEVILVGPPQAARALQKATTTVPIATHWPSRGRAATRRCGIRPKSSSRCAARARG